MEVFSTIAEIRRFVSSARRENRRIGCVPTMGALHAGHLSLMQSCRERVDKVVATIFVNPTQFAPHEDLTKYPRPLENDLAACASVGVDVVFTPNVAELYPPGFQTWVEVGELSTLLEGEFRPGHFRGVTTIVCKLFNIVRPDVACFGQKDYQQQALIRQMVRDLDLPIEIVVCPTTREPDGLAMSSRNVYLSPAERQTARKLSAALRLADSLCRGPSPRIEKIEAAMRRHLEHDGDVRVQYAVLRDPDSLQPLAGPQTKMVALIAGFVGTTRLIDNELIELDAPAASSEF